MPNKYDNERELSEWSDASETVPLRGRGTPGKVTLTERLAGRRGRTARPSPGKISLTMSLQGTQVARKATSAGSSEPAGSLADARGSAGQRLDDGLRQAMEPSAGDLSGVRVHTGPESNRASADLGAFAFAEGQQIHFAAGQYQPDTPTGQHLIAHEVAHTIQQRGQTTGVQAKLVVSQPGDAQEREADAFADAFALGQSAPVSPGAGPAGLSRSPAPAAESQPRTDRVAAEDTLIALLQRPLAKTDASGLQQRKRELVALFRALPTGDRAALQVRLAMPERGDRLASLFHYRLATTTRNHLVASLSGEPTPVPASASIEPDAFAAGLSEDTLVLMPPLVVVPEGRETTPVMVAALSQLAPPGGHRTELMWRVEVGDDQQTVHSGTLPWEPTQTKGVAFTLEVPAGRHYVHAEVVIDGAVHRILRTLLTVAPPGNLPVAAGALPADVADTLRFAFERPLGNDGARFDQLDYALSTIALPHRARAIELLSSPSADNEIGRLFYANIPEVSRRDVIAMLAGRFQRGGDDGAAPEVASQLGRAELVAPATRVVIGPWMEPVLRIKPRSESAAEALFGAAPSSQQTIDVWWTIQDPLGVVSEHTTHWQVGHEYGTAVSPSAVVSGIYTVRASFGTGGSIVAQRSLEVPVEVHGNTGEAAAAMTPEQLVAERATLRGELANTSLDRSTDGARTAALGTYAVLGGALASADNAPKEAQPPVPQGELFAPADWMRGSLFNMGVPLSKDPAQLRWAIEESSRRGNGPTYLFDRARAYKSYIAGQRDRDQDRDLFNEIFPLLRQQIHLFHRERELFVARFGTVGKEVALQILEDSERRIDDQIARYGLTAGATSDPEQLTALAGAARELRVAQRSLETTESQLRQVEDELRAMNRQSGQGNEFDGQFDILDQHKSRLKKQRDLDQQGLDALRIAKSADHPILAIADDVDKPARYDLHALNRLTDGDTQYMVDELADVRDKIDTVRGEFSDQSVWRVADLIPIVRAATGAAPGTLEGGHIDNQVGLISAGKTVAAVSDGLLNLFALLFSWTGVGPLVWLLDGIVLAKDVYNVSEAIDDYRFAKAAAGTDIDKARAISQSDPSLGWLAVSIVGVGLGGVAALKTLSDARKAFAGMSAARKAAIAAKNPDDLARRLDELDALRREAGLPNGVGDRLRDDALDGADPGLAKEVRSRRSQKLDTGSGRKGNGKLDADADADGNGSSLGDPAGRQNRDGPYADPNVDPKLPRRYLDRRELLPARKIHRHTSWADAAKTLKKKNSAAIGKILKNPEDGHDVISRLARGDATALKKLGIDDYPDGVDVTGREWSLVQTRNGYVVYAGKYNSVELPANVRSVAHNHPGPKPTADFGKRGKQSAVDDLHIPDGAHGVLYEDIIRDWERATGSGITPSAPDVHAISDGAPHVIYTRYVHRGNKRIDNPVDGNDANRIALHLSNTRVAQWNPRQKAYVYEVDVRVRDAAGDELWTGKMYVEWYAVEPGFGRITAAKPDRLRRPPQPGWQVGPE